MKKFFFLTAIVLGSFFLGTVAEGDRRYRNECVRLGGEANILFQCTFNEKYDSMKMGAISKLCADPAKAWYIYNDADTRWRHKCA